MKNSDDTVGMFLWVLEIFKSAITYITFKNLQFYFEDFMLSSKIGPSVVLQTAVMWRSGHSNAKEICKTTSVYKSTRHTVLEMILLYSSEMKVFHQNTQQINQKQNLD
jgi:hypothetical protein